MSTCRHLSWFLFGVVLVFYAAQARAQDNSVGVVAVGNASAAGFKGVARVVVAIRAELKARGRKVVDPAENLQSKDIPLPGLALKAQKELILATKLYDSLEFAKARAGFKTAIKFQRQSIQYGSPSKDYLKTLQYLAAAAFYDGDKDAAMSHFSEFLAFDPKLKPDEGVFSPDVLKVFEEAKAKEWKKGSMKLKSTPNAEVYVNGRYRGITPLKVSKLVPANYLIQFRSPGYDVVLQWIAVEPEGVAEVSSELKEGPQYKTYAHALVAVNPELKTGRPGPTVTRLRALLGAESLILVVRRGKKIQATWAQDKYWVKRYQGTVKRGKERAFAAKLLTSKAPVVVPKAQCSRSADCTSGKQCLNGKCIAQGTSVPVYKKWWFWTIVGAVVVGGTVGVIVGTQPASWNAQVVPGVGP